MPDQSSAASEHALVQEITAPLAALPEDPIKMASDVDFPVVLRGYDRIAVDAYVKKTSQIVAELEATRSPEGAVRRALDRVGGEVSGILQRAHETAAQITAQSRAEAEQRLEAAREEAEQIVAAARAEVQELDAETDRIWAERQRIVEDARDLSRQLLGLADSAAERFPADEEATPAPAAETVEEPEAEASAGAEAAPFAEGPSEAEGAPFAEAPSGPEAAPFAEGPSGAEAAPYAATPPDPEVPPGEEAAGGGLDDTLERDRTTFLRPPPPEAPA